MRQLERNLGSVARKVALRIAQAQAETVNVAASDIREYLGLPRFYPEEARKELPAGVATGMAWTEMGGEVLFIKRRCFRGRGLTITGQLGEVMQESARAAQSLLWSHAVEFGIEPRSSRSLAFTRTCRRARYRRMGPSAGVTITSALASLYTGRRVAGYGDDRRDHVVRPRVSIWRRRRRCWLRIAPVFGASFCPRATKRTRTIFLRCAVMLDRFRNIAEVLDAALEVLVANPPPVIAGSDSGPSFTRTRARTTTLLCV